MDRIQQELARLSKNIPGTVGIFAQHIPTGHSIELNGDTHFPMASAFKLPIAVHLLSLGDQGRYALDQMVEVRQSDISPGSGIIRSRLYQPGLILSIQNLLDLMLVISDNTAADVLLRLAGGPQAVTDFLRRQQIEGICVDRYLKQMVADKFGVAGLPEGEDWSIEAFDRSYETLSEEDKQAAAARFSADDRDTMTPAGMVHLLTSVVEGEVLRPKSRDLLTGIMMRCETGEGAIKGMLPPGTPVAHKTGTLAEVVANDVGIITLPDEAGQIAIAISIQSKAAIADASSPCQRTIAHIARTIYDTYLFTS